MLILHADPRQSSAEHQNRLSDSDTLELIRSRRVWYDTLKRLGQYIVDYYIGDDARPKIMDPPSDVEYDYPAELEFMEKNPEFYVHRQEYADALEKAGWYERKPHGDWQDTFENVEIGDVIMFQSGERVEDSDLPAEEDLSWYPTTPGGPLERNITRNAIVFSAGFDFIALRVTYPFEDIPGSPGRGQKVLDDVFGGMRYALEEYVHIVARGSASPANTEPQCFNGGIQLDWRTKEGVPPPSNKNWFMDARAGEDHTIRNGPLCVVGSPGDFKDFSSTLDLVNRTCCIRSRMRHKIQFLLAEAEARRE
jgi:hypothetical protein